MLIEQNMHTHTRLSYCGGRDSIIANTVAEAESVGLKMIGISDHIDLVDDRRAVLIDQNREELAKIDTNIKVLIGAELSLNDPDTLPATDEEIGWLDYMVVSANHYHVPGVKNPDEMTEEAYADWFIEMASGAIRLGASIIPHPFSYVGVRQIDGRPVDFQRLLKAYDMNRVRSMFRLAAEVGTAFELNPGRMGQFSDFFAKLVPIARDEGMKFSFGSDGHHPGSMHYGGVEKLREAEALFRSIGVTEDLICQEYRVRRN